MRVVNQNVRRLLRERKSGKASKNTEVVWHDSDGGYGAVYLFDKHIANVWPDQWRVAVNYGTLHAWPTVTTLDRLNALGFRVWKRHGVLQYD